MKKSVLFETQDPSVLEITPIPVLLTKNDGCADRQKISIKANKKVGNPLSSFELNPPEIQ